MYALSVGCLMASSSKHRPKLRLNERLVPRKRKEAVSGCLWVLRSRLGRLKRTSDEASTELMLAHVPAIKVNAAYNRAGHM